MGFSDDNECSNPDPYPGRCSHICTNTVGSFRCSCPDEMLLDSDQKTCTCEYCN